MYQSKDQWWSFVHQGRHLDISLVHLERHLIQGKIAELKILSECTVDEIHLVHPVTKKKHVIIHESATKINT